MREDQQFYSILAPFIEGLLTEKRSLGFDYHTEELILVRFDRYCSEVGLETPNITKAFLDKWCSQTDNEGLSNKVKRISAVRQLMLYMVSMGIQVYLPNSGGKKQAVLPHIFTQGELLEFFNQVDTYKPISDHSVDKRLAKEYMVLFRLIYCCGLRNSEGCGIASEQVDISNGVLTILNSKGNKDRLVYMAADLSELCREYFEYLCNELSFRPKWFFPGRDPQKPLRNTSIDRVFNRFWAETDYASSCNNKPTVHDLRFTFVTDRINTWAIEGIDIAVMMPYLQKYLGHKSLQDSYYYYHTSRQLYEAIKIKDKTAGQVIPEVPAYE